MADQLFFNMIGTIRYQGSRNVLNSSLAKFLLIWIMINIWLSIVIFAVEMVQHSGTEVILLTNDRTGSEPKTQLH